MDENMSLKKLPGIEREKEENPEKMHEFTLVLYVYVFLKDKIIFCFE